MLSAPLAQTHSCLKSLESSLKSKLGMNSVNPLQVHGQHGQLLPTTFLVRSLLVVSPSTSNVNVHPKLAEECCHWS
jgi:hypothetical protein